MGKVKVVSKNNQVSVKVKSTKDEQLNQNMAELLSNTAVEDVQFGRNCHSKENS
jgi:hypothetical protein